MMDAIANLPHEQQRAFILARLRSYGPAFGHELIAEDCALDPGARVEELCAEGFHIEALRIYRPKTDGPGGWSVLYVMRLKDPSTGEVIAAPVPVGAGRMLERWAA